MANVLVLGAAGTLGRHVAELAETKHDVLRSSRQAVDGWARIDLGTGDGIAAFRDVDCIIHCGAAPFTRHERHVEADAMGSLRLAAPEARILYPSIVGIDRIPHFRYYRTKVAGERALAEAGGDHAIVRFTQFHEFADRFARMRVPTFPRHFTSQSLAAREAAAELVRQIKSKKQGLVGDFGGPEVHALRDMVRQRLEKDGRKAPVIQVPMGRFSKALKQGLNLCPDATQGTTTWAEHLAGEA